MDVNYETLGQDRVVISLKDFQNMLDIIAYDEAKREKIEIFPIEFTQALIADENPLKAFRKHRKLSQVMLSKASGVPQGQISEIENGKKTGSVESLKALARVLGVDIGDLIE